MFRVFVLALLAILLVGLGPVFAGGLPWYNNSLSERIEGELSADSTFDVVTIVEPSGVRRGPFNVDLLGAGDAECVRAFSALASNTSFLRKSTFPSSNYELRALNREMSVWRVSEPRRRTITGSLNPVKRLNYLDIASFDQFTDRWISVNGIDYQIVSPGYGTESSGIEQLFLMDSKGNRASVSGINVKGKLPPDWFLLPPYWNHRLTPAHWKVGARGWITSDVTGATGGEQFSWNGERNVWLSTEMEANYRQFDALSSQMRIAWNRRKALEPQYAFAWNVHQIDKAILAGQYQKAEHHCDEAIALQPNGKGLHLRRGFVYLRQNLPQLAESDLTVSLQRDGPDAELLTTALIAETFSLSGMVNSDDYKAKAFHAKAHEYATRSDQIRKDPAKCVAAEAASPAVYAVLIKGAILDADSSLQKIVNEARLSDMKRRADQRLVSGLQLAKGGKHLAAEKQWAHAAILADDQPVVVQPALELTAWSRSDRGLSEPAETDEVAKTLHRQASSLGARLASHPLGISYLSELQGIAPQASEHLKERRLKSGTDVNLALTAIGQVDLKRRADLRLVHGIDAWQRQDFPDAETEWKRAGAIADDQPAVTLPSYELLCWMKSDQGKKSGVDEKGDRAAKQYHREAITATGAISKIAGDWEYFTKIETAMQNQVRDKLLVHRENNRLLPVDQAMQRLGRADMKARADRRLRNGLTLWKSQDASADKELKLAAEIGDDMPSVVFPAIELRVWLHSDQATATDADASPTDVENAHREAFKMLSAPESQLIAVAPTPLTAEFGTYLTVLTDLEPGVVVYLNERRSATNGQALALPLLFARNARDNLIKRGTSRLNETEQLHTNSENTLTVMRELWAKSSIGSQRLDWEYPRFDTAINALTGGYDHCQKTGPSILAIANEFAQFATKWETEHNLPTQASVVIQNARALENRLRETATDIRKQLERYEDVYCKRLIVDGKLDEAMEWAVRSALHRTDEVAKP